MDSIFTTPIFFTGDKDLIARDAGDNKLLQKMACILYAAAGTLTSLATAKMMHYPGRDKLFLGRKIAEKGILAHLREKKKKISFFSRKKNGLRHRQQVAARSHTKERVQTMTYWTTVVVVVGRDRL